MSKAPMSPLGQSLFDMMNAMTKASLLQNDTANKMRVVDELRRKHQPLILQAMKRPSKGEMK